MYLLNSHTAKQNQRNKQRQVVWCSPEKDTALAPERLLCGTDLAPESMQYSPRRAVCWAGAMLQCLSTLATLAKDLVGVPLPMWQLKKNLFSKAKTEIQGSHPHQAMRAPRIQGSAQPFGRWGRGQERERVQLGTQEHFAF